MSPAETPRKREARRASPRKSRPDGDVRMAAMRALSLLSAEGRFFLTVKDGEKTEVISCWS